MGTIWDAAHLRVTQTSPGALTTEHLPAGDPSNNNGKRCQGGDQKVVDVSTAATQLSTAQVLRKTKPLANFASRGLSTAKAQLYGCSSPDENAKSKHISCLGEEALHQQLLQRELFQSQIPPGTQLGYA